MNIDEVLKDRGQTHGLFSENAVMTQELRTTFRLAPNWELLSPSQRLALDEIALKIARMLSTGVDPKNPEHFLDICGYAALGARHA
jgi:hypothetical protein